MVTGATGFIGNNLTHELLKRKYEVNLLVRSKNRLDNKLKTECKVFEGDLHDLDVIKDSVKNCDCIFHLAAYANIWSRDKSLAYNTNVEGTKNIFEAALKNSVKKTVFTSSAATLAPSTRKEEVNESFPEPENYLTDYESTKHEAEKLALEYCNKGLDISIVNPTRVFGPGLLSKSNSVTILIKKYISGTWRFIPGSGKQIGNYVYVDDVVKGHIFAQQYGKPGERYILGGTNISFNGFFELLKEVSGKNYKLYHLPHSLMLAISKFELFMAEVFGKKPLITPPWIKRYVQHRLVSSQKAIGEIHYTITPLNKAMELTIAWINKTKN